MRPKNDIIDVEFETVKSDKNQWPAGDNENNTIKVSQIQDHRQLGIFGKARDKNKSVAMSLPVFTILASICSFSAFYFAGGHILFSSPSEPQVSEKTKTPLIVRDVISQPIKRGENSYVVLTATIVNTDKIATTISPIIVKLGSDPQTRRTFHIKRGEILNPGESLTFTNTLPASDDFDTKPELLFLE